MDGLFFLDSDELNNVEDRLCGYMMIQDRIITDFDQILCDEGIFNAYGCYTLIQRKGDTITISQDYNGSFGLYVFCKDDYFAISNSFLLLVERVKKYGLSINRDNVRCHLVEDYLNLSYRTTMVNEISVLDRNEYITIDTKNRRFKIKNVVHKENQVELDSMEGLHILDTWYEKWIDIIRRSYAEGKPIDVDLTGGMDSRLVFSLFLNAQIDLDHINIISYMDGSHTHKEDYEIASCIADRYSFKLNDLGRYECEGYDQKQRIELPLYTKIGSHKQLYYRYGRNKEMRYRFTGGGGEKIRGYWDITPDQFKAREKEKAKDLFTIDSGAICRSIDLVYDSTFEHLREKYAIKDPASREISTYLWNDIADGRHFGRIAAESFLSGEIDLQPLSDPLLQRLKVVDEGCGDYKKIVAVIFDRYMSELLSIRFDSGHVIAERTIEEARSINDRSPYRKRPLERLDRVSIQKRDVKKPAGKAPGRLADEWIQAAFYAEDVRKAIAEQLTDQLYLSVCVDCELRDYFPLTNVYPLLFVAYLTDQRPGTMYGYLQKMYKKDARAPYKDICKTFLPLSEKNGRSALYVRWMADPTAVTDYLDGKGYQKIAIYGAGKIGESLFEKIVEHGYEIAFIMDRNISKKIGGYQAISIESEWPECDVIIVTVSYAFEEIRKQLQDKRMCPVVSLRDLVDRH